MIVTVVDKRLCWFLFPGRKRASSRGSLLEGGKLICFTGNRKEASSAKKVFSLTSSDCVIVCDELAGGLDLSQWISVYEYLVNTKKYHEKKSVRKLFENVEDEESVDFLLKFIGEAMALGKWPEHTAKKRKRVFQLCEAVASGSDTKALQEWFLIDEPGMVTGLVAKMCARAKGNEKEGSEWAMKVAKHAGQTCDISNRSFGVLAEDRFTERFQSLAFILGLMGVFK